MQMNELKDEFRHMFKMGGLNHIQCKLTLAEQKNCNLRICKLLNLHRIYQSVFRIPELLFPMWPHFPASPQVKGGYAVIKYSLSDRAAMLSDR